MSNPLLEARAIHKGFGQGQSRVEVLRGVDLVAHSGEMTAIVGASGSGKTTLLQILGTLDAPDGGELLFSGESLLELEEKKLARHRNRNIGFIFQFHHLLPEFSALENVMMPGRISGRPEAEIQSRAGNLLDRVGLANRLEHRPGELSGGEQQRVALARALVMEPDVLLADEPTGNLDAGTSDEIVELLLECNREFNTTLLLVTHSQRLAAKMDRIIVIENGQII